jgi:hypothetical protein
VAYRIRRSGDQLEVLVRFDKSGQVSMDSPVENVVEITGGRREKGDTKAKVLGEFVGAKKYEVDSYVAFESNMDEIVPPLRAAGFELSPRTEIEGRHALRALLPNQVENPRVEWPDILPPVASSSNLKFEFAYFIPKTNQNLKGFTLRWGIGTPMEGKSFDSLGRWSNEIFESESPNEYTTLRLYGLGVPQVGGKVNGGNESLYLDDLKVTYLSFAAHIVETYKDGKVVSRVIDEPTAQKAIVLSGKLLPTQPD